MKSKHCVTCVCYKSKKYSCEHCGKMCVKQSARALCSLKCRLLGNIKKDDECWIWQGRVNSWGYGEIMLSGKRYSAHRTAYGLFRSPVPSDKILLHSCDKPGCINPQHLTIGTNKENSVDMKIKGRSLTGNKNPSRNNSYVKERREELNEIIKSMK